LKQTTIDEGIFIGIKISMREGEVMATGSKRGSSVDAALRWKKITYKFVYGFPYSYLCQCECSFNSKKNDADVTMT